MSRSAGRPGRPPSPVGFPRSHRLVAKPQFDALHRRGQRSSDSCFLVLARANEVGHARLGLAVGTRVARSSVNRNRIKRLVRESFRLIQQELPPVDLVVNARPAAAQASNPELRASLAGHWRRVCDRCAAS